MALNPATVGKRVEQGLDPVYFIYGAEPLLIEESCDAIRAAARAEGYDERIIETVDGQFDFDKILNLGAAQSLFSMRRIIEFRLTSPRMGDVMAKLDDLLGTPPADTIILVVGGKVDARSRKAKWFGRIESIATLVECSEVPPAKMIGWLKSRLASRNLKAADGVFERMAWFLEGNLLAAAQEIDRLALTHVDREISVQDIDDNLSDHARFTVPGWIDTLLIGRISRALRILDGLEREGIEPIYILVLLSREMRLITRIASEIEAGMPIGKALQKNRVWNTRERFVKQALERLSASQWRDIHDQVARADRILKGRGDRLVGRDAFDEFERLALLICGVSVGQLPRTAAG